MSSSEEQDQVYGACLAALRQTDLDRYLSCLLIAPEKRGAIAALYAFNAEIARIRDVIREPLPGEIRIQWWRDLIAGAASKSANPLASGLLLAIQEHHLPPDVLINLLEARIFDLYDDPMRDISSFEGYAGETASALIQLASLILAPEAAKLTSDAAGHAGVAQWVAGSLLLMPLHIRRHQIFLPGDILSSTGLTPEEFLKGEDRGRIGVAISAFVGFGRDHLSKARKTAKGHLKGELMGAFLPISLVEPVLDRAIKAGANLVERPIQPSQLSRQWRMWRASRLHRF